MKNFDLLKIIIVLFIVFSFSSCEKDAGEGGTSSIYGKVWVRDFNANFTILQYQYSGTDEDIYIIYGDNKSYGDRIKCGPEGVFEFKYLRPGKYKVYALAKDSIAFSNQLFPIIKEVEITENNQEVDAGTIVIQK